MKFSRDEFIYNGKEFDRFPSNDEIAKGINADLDLIFEYIEELENKNFDRFKQHLEKHGEISEFIYETT
ncbi:MAG: hypothetical protein COB42_06805 [Sulfurimonas sp.]|nr:MAG: hypothetical protein COB42_06805 [Sulfurimonas sp.]